MEFLIDASHLPGWTAAKVQDRVSDEVFNGEEARILATQNLGRGFVAKWRPEFADTGNRWKMVTRAEVFFSRPEDEAEGTPLNPEFPGWAHHRFYTGAQLVYECVVPARRDAL